MDELDSRVYSELKTPIKSDELIRRLPDISRRALAASLERLIATGDIMRSKKNKFGQTQAFGCLCGTFISTPHSFSFVSHDNEALGADVFIPPHCDGGAWHGDRVIIQLNEKATGMRRGVPRHEGTVVQIIERSRRDLTGTVEKHGRALFVSADSPVFPPIELVKNRLEGAQVGDRVAVRLVFWGDDKKKLPAQGVVTANLGVANTMESSIAASLHANGIWDLFPEDTLEQAHAAGQTISPDDFEGRTDLRDHALFTIDGDDAKDFDDAVSLEILENGHRLLGVHIADVSHYVTKDSPLDTEALRRGTSVYYPGHVVPMLPFALSNGICSLAPDVDRFAFSAFMELDETGKRHGCRFVKSIIRSKARLTYNKVNLILAGDAELRTEYAALTEMLEQMNVLAHTLRRRRIERGALELDIPEVQIVVDDEGKATGVCERDRGDSEKLIEDFMLLANEAVAEFLCRRDNPAIYRVHENPDPEKLRAFATFAHQFGYRVDASKPNDTAQLQLVLNSARDKPDQRVLPMLLLRSLARARYSYECIGHYGLHAKFYLHFTSPIRRYPDLVVHRMLGKAISEQTFTPADELFCEEAAVQSTIREQAADKAERTIDKLFIADYMAQFVGQDFDGTVSGVAAFGLFIALENGVEGMVRVADLPGEGYEFDPDRMTLTAARSGARFAIGAPLRVRLTAASNVTGQIDFCPSPQE